MPWKRCSVMDERVKFVARRLAGEAMADLCREFGISRKTGYKIFDRYPTRHRPGHNHASLARFVMAFTLKHSCLPILRILRLRILYHVLIAFRGIGEIFVLGNDAFEIGSQMRL